MRIIIEKDYQAMSKKAALMLAGQITLNPKSNLGLATGGTPLKMYAELIKMYKNNEINFNQIKTFNLDEYCGLEAKNPNSYHYYMNDNFFNQINIKKENIHIPDGNPENFVKECRDYEKSIQNAGGIDLQILGIGSNAHIGFNEPADNLNAATEVVDLNEETIADNSRYFENKDEVPKKAISMGIGTILKADRIILLASGKNKAEAIKKAITGKISTQVPASLLKTHPKITFILDKDAASLIDKEKLSANCQIEIY